MWKIHLKKSLWYASSQKNFSQTSTRIHPPPQASTFRTSFSATYCVCHTASVQKINLEWQSLKDEDSTKDSWKET